VWQLASGRHPDLLRWQQTTGPTGLPVPACLHSLTPAYNNSPWIEGSPLFRLGPARALAEIPSLAGMGWLAAV